jgi:hypothetical protein
MIITNPPIHQRMLVLYHCQICPSYRACYPCFDNFLRMLESKRRHSARPSVDPGDCAPHAFVAATPALSGDVIPPTAGSVV